MKTEQAPKTRLTIEAGQDNVDGRSLWRLLGVCVLLLGVAGASLRLYFSPRRVNRILDRALAGQTDRFGVTFQGSRLQLTDGLWPQMALVIEKLEINPARDCRPEPGARINKLIIPLRISGLLKGQIAIGRLRLQGVEADVDGLKFACKSSTAQPVDRRHKAGAKINEPESDGVNLSERAELPVWWKPGAIRKSSAQLEGVVVDEAVVQFENKTKSVYLKRLSIEAASLEGDEKLKLNAEVSVPPDLTFGEQVPLLRIEALAGADRAELVVKASLDEGRLLANGHLRPTAEGNLEADLKAVFGRVPLSALVPLVTKSGMIRGTFQPRFLWMNCEASIHGRFHGLLQNAPLAFENCEVIGNASKIRFSKTSRHPNGVWDPIQVELENADLGHLLETFGLVGLNGVIADYGRMDGKVSIEPSGLSRYEGRIRGARVRFSSRNVRAEQEIEDLSARLELAAGQVRGEIGELRLLGGEFAGQVGVALDHRLERGTLRAVVDKLKFSPEVQRVLVGGSLRGISGQIEAKLFQGEISGLVGHLHIDGVDGREFRAERIDFDASMVGANHTPQVVVKTPVVFLHSDSPIMRALRPAFFTHEFASDWIPVADARTQIRFLKAEPKIGSEGVTRVSWVDAAGRFEAGRISMLSSGSAVFGQGPFVRLQGEVFADFPRARRLHWRLGGSLNDPLLTEEGAGIRSLRDKLGSQNEIDDSVLGLGTSI